MYGRNYVNPKDMFKEREEYQQEEKEEEEEEEEEEDMKAGLLKKLTSSLYNRKPLLSKNRSFVTKPIQSIDKRKHYFKYKDVKNVVISAVKSSLKQMLSSPPKNKIYTIEKEDESEEEIHVPKRNPERKPEPKEKPIPTELTHEKEITPPLPTPPVTPPQKEEKNYTIVLPTSYPLSMIDSTLKFVQSFKNFNSGHPCSLWTSKLGPKCKTQLASGAVLWLYDHAVNAWIKTDRKTVDEIKGDKFDIKTSLESPADWVSTKGYLAKMM